MTIDLRSVGLTSADRPMEHLYDYIGIGFGPSNIALAVAIDERSRQTSGLFIERQPGFQWHTGMMFDRARMQISFLKDLATLRNPSSRYTFLQFLKHNGRLEHFVNLRDFYPSRREFEEYFAWVAQHFNAQVRYGSLARRVMPVLDDSGTRISALRVEVQDGPTQEVRSYLTRNVVYAPGGRPNLLETCVPAQAGAIHSADFLTRFPASFPDADNPYRLAIIGAGQSAAEIAEYILTHYLQATVDLIVPNYTLRAADQSAFINEIFFATETDRFREWDSPGRAAALAQARNTNYGVIDSDLLDSLYRLDYGDRASGKRRLSVRGFSRLVSAARRHDSIEAVIADVSSGAQSTTVYDGLILATGFTHRVDEAVFGDMLPLLSLDESGEPRISRGYKLETNLPADAGIFVQGLHEHSHGPGETLLSLLPFRAERIAEQICSNSAPAGRTRATPPASEPQALTNPAYPPRRHVEDDREKLFAVVERFPFATVISTHEGTPTATHVPLILDRMRGANGVLFGHMDRNNPHVQLLEQGGLLAIFHGPNAYISPRTYTTDQLPTWNSISVHVRGRVRVLGSAHDVVRGLCGICEHADRSADAYRLDPGTHAFRSCFRTSSRLKSTSSRWKENSNCPRTAAKATVHWHSRR